MSSTNEQFYDRACSALVRLTVHVSGPRQSVKLRAAEDLLSQQAGAITNTTISLIPKELQSAWRKAQRDMKATLSDLGWIMSTDSGGSKFILPVEALNDALAAVAKCHAECRDHARDYVFEGADRAVQAELDRAWDAFRHQCVSTAGNLEVPVGAFPYDQASEYIDHFEVDSHVEALQATASDSLPNEVVARIASDACLFLDTVLNQMRERIADECDRLAGKIGSDSRVTRASFNALLEMTSVAQSVTADTAPSIHRLATGFPGFLDTIDNFSMLGPNLQTNDKFDAALTERVQGSLTLTAQRLRDEIAGAAA